jgi:hypothetical protein
MKNLITIINSKELENIWSRNSGEEKPSATSTVQDDGNNIHHEHLGDASKSDVSPNTPKADEADL